MVLNMRNISTKHQFLKAILLILGFLYIAPNSYAEDYVCPDASYVKSVGSQPAGCTAVSEANIPAQRDIADKVPQFYRKVVSNLLVEMTSLEKSVVDSAAAAAATASLRSSAKSEGIGLAPAPLYQRAVADTINDRENTTAGKVNDILDCFDNNSTVGNIRGCIVGLSDLNDSVSLVTVKNTIESKIDGGTLDNG